MLRLSYASPMTEMTDGDRLRALLGNRKKSAWAKEHRISGGGSMISQHLSGHRPISFEQAVVYARCLGVTLDEVSPAHAELARAAAELLSGGRRSAAPDISEALPVVLEALAKSQHRGEIRTLLGLLVDSDSPLYRQRLTEILAGQPANRRAAA